MDDIVILHTQVKKFFDEASEKELELVYHLFEATNKRDWWNDISELQRKVIDKGIAQLDNGEGITHKAVMEKCSKWIA